MERIRAVIGWLRGLNTLVVDSVLAAGLFALTLVEMATLHCDCITTADRVWTVAFMALQTFPLALRRRYPFTVMNVVGVSAIAYDLLDIPPDPYTAIFAILVGLYTVSAYARRDRAIIAGVVVLLAVVVLNLPAVAGTQDFRDVVSSAVFLGGAWILGDSVRSRRRRDELLRERAERAEREREERAERAAIEERSRIAREIHDVVTHSVSVIAIQAGAARTIVREDPQRAVEALRSIEEVSRDTMTELRRALGVLRAPADEVSLAPQPGLGSLDDLVQQFRRAGLVVDVAREGSPRDLPAGVDLAAYRVVQEALTNTLRHAGAKSAHVLVRYADDGIDVTVSDDGRPVEGGSAETSAAPARGNGEGDLPSGGHGLVGMRERVALFGGSLEARPEGGGFAVRATFPVSSERPLS